MLQRSKPLPLLVVLGNSLVLGISEVAALLVVLKSEVLKSEVLKPEVLGSEVDPVLSKVPGELPPSNVLVLEDEVSCGDDDGEEDEPNDEDGEVLKMDVVVLDTNNRASPNRLS